MTRVSVFAPVRWAKTVPPILRSDGQPDQTAHYVLLALATWANADGTGARPSVRQLAQATYSDTTTVERALDRIQAAGLISKTCDLNGTSVWTLHLTVVHDGPTITDRRIERRRATDAERQRRRRARRAGQVGRHAVGERDVTPSDTVTAPVDNPVDNPDVTQSHTVTYPVGHGVPPRDVTGSDTVTSRTQDRDTRRSEVVYQPLLTSHLNQPITLSPDAARREDFDEFWSIYPRKVGKTAARKAWDRALRDATPEAILTGAARFAAQRAGQDPKFTPHPATWLNAGRWDDEDTPGLRAVSGGYRPWANPANHDAYDEELL
ncbi:MarR family winged helix-turn-helix transcriptional regulator [Crossiella sp. SN42]|uniref:MarR family winged helix-turn-helix transcriptional regulator n=1 Tax=Crossiella sp. SN42 TaxID=2944808 RepID=UPI00207C1668|nr:MarR family winged helix-turn-helix transcriptional regulator [Crossiella sp. SN42]MCO1575005.1 MarR family winged helix-turn-helix transcriptional regulator [Crossiella sp. SN42]